MKFLEDLRLKLSFKKSVKKQPVHSSSYITNQAQLDGLARMGVHPGGKPWDLKQK